MRKFPHITRETTQLISRFDSERELFIKRAIYKRSDWPERVKTWASIKPGKVQPAPSDGSGYTNLPSAKLVNDSTHDSIITQLCDCLRTQTEAL